MDCFCLSVFCTIDCFCLSLFMNYRLILFICVFVLYVDSVYLCFYNRLILYICVCVPYFVAVYLCFCTIF